MPDPLATYAARQQTPIREDEVANNAGGFVFAISPLQRLERFLVLGTQGGTYYQSETELTQENAEALRETIQADGLAVVGMVIDVSLRGRAPRQHPTLFALAACSAYGNDETRRAAHAAVPTVCRTGTHLFLFSNYVELLRGWGRGPRRAVARWYEDQPVDDLALQLIKYRQREGWSHRDLLRLTHPKTSDALRDSLFGFAVGHPDFQHPLIQAFQAVQSDISIEAAVALIRAHRLPWEALPDRLLNEPATWDAILDSGIGSTALIRQLPRLSRLLLTSEPDPRVLKGLSLDRLKLGRVHPVTVLSALATYRTGHGLRGSAVWTPLDWVVMALEEAFYAAFETIEVSNARMLLALDVSGSMDMALLNLNLSCREAAAVMAMVTAKKEPNHQFLAFSGPAGYSRPWGRSDEPIDTRIMPLDIMATHSLETVLRRTVDLPFSTTDCALPMLYASAHEIEVDTFAVYTDNETWAGDIHPWEALRRYRADSGIPAKLVVVGMTSTGFSIADPSDPYTLDVVGFDSATPAAISAFSR